jgi:hypothetical protein
MPWTRSLLVLLSMNILPCARSLPKGQHTWAELQRVSRQQLRFGMSGTDIEGVLGRPDRSQTYPCDTHARTGDPATPMCASWSYYGKDQFRSLLLMMDVNQAQQFSLRAWAL